MLTNFFSISILIPGIIRVVSLYYKTLDDAVEAAKITLEAAKENLFTIGIHEHIYEPPKEYEKSDIYALGSSVDNYVWVYGNISDAREKQIGYVGYDWRTEQFQLFPDSDD